MLFTLEALEAAHGDSLLMHYGTPQEPKTIIIDGGPPGNFAKRLQPRLEELRSARVGESPLPIPYLILSHIDDDHVAGVLSLTTELIRAKEDGDPRIVSIQQMWHNSFDDLVKPVAAAPAAIAASIQLASIGAPLPGKFKKMSEEAQLVLATVPQGRQLRNDAAKLGIKVNNGFANGLVVAPAGKAKSKDIGSGLTLTVAGPRQEQLDALQNDWAKQLAKLKKAGKLKPAELSEAVAAEFVDKSVYNLSSIVVLAECGGKTMLLTGDARGDFTIEALEESGLKKKGKPLKVDILKMPHHGSWRNIADSFFKDIVADHYVISANGKYDNPDLPTVKSLLKVRPKGGYTVYMTNRHHYQTKKELPAATYLVKNAKAKNVTVVFGDETAAIPSIVIDLGQPLKD